GRGRRRGRGQPRPRRPHAAPARAVRRRGGPPPGRRRLARVAPPAPGAPGHRGPGVIRVEDHGEVTFFRLARRLGPWPIYWTGAYLVDGLLVDCGPPATARAFVRALEGRRVEALVAT